eukprot:Opistho-2@42246
MGTRVWPPQQAATTGSPSQMRPPAPSSPSSRASTVASSSPSSTRASFASSPQLTPGASGLQRPPPPATNATAPVHSSPSSPPMAAPARPSRLPQSPMTSRPAPPSTVDRESSPASSPHPTATRPPAPARPSLPENPVNSQHASAPPRPKLPAQPAVDSTAVAPSSSSYAASSEATTPGKITLPPPRARQVAEQPKAALDNASSSQRSHASDDIDYPHVRGYEVKTDAYTKEKIVLYIIEIAGQNVYRRLAETREFHGKVSKLLAKMNAGEPPAFPVVNVGVFGSMEKAVADLDEYFRLMANLPEEVLTSSTVADFFRATPKDLQEREAGAAKAAKRNDPAAILAIHVVDCKKIRDPGEKFYAYGLEVSHGDGSTVIVWRRYREFFDFVGRLKEIYPTESGSLDDALPPRKFFGRSQVKDVASQRVPDLDKFMQYVMSNELTSDCQQLRYFLHPTFNNIVPPP